MVLFEHTLLVMLLILFFGLVLPDILKRFNFPFATSLIILGAIFGPHGLNYIKADNTVSFFGFLGSTFLLLMAGLEVRTERFANIKQRILPIALANSLIPFAVGMAITRLFGYSWTASFVVGTLFVSSSVAIIVSAIKSAKLANTEIGKVIIGVTIIEDIFSLLLLSIILQSIQPITNFPLPIYFGILIGSIFVLKLFIPEIAVYFLGERRRKHRSYEGHLRFVIVVLIAVILFLDRLGVHPIVGAFVVGILLADIVKSKIIHHKLSTLGYGIFVPIFFFVVGMELDFSIFLNFDFKNLLLLSLIVGLVLSKFFSGYIAARIENFSGHEARIFGIASTAQLTTTLAAAFAASSLNIIDTTLVTAVVVLAIVTTIITPVALNIIAKKRSRSNA